MKKYFLMIAVVLFILSCMEFTSSIRQTEPQYYITGLLVEGETVDFEHAIFIGKTIPAEDGFIDIDDLIISDASVMLYEMDTNNTILDSTVLTFVVNPNELEQYGYIDLEGDLIIKTERRYRIEVVINSEDTVWAVTQVPDSVQVIADSLITQNSGFTTNPQPEVWPQMEFDTIDEEHPIQIKTVNNEVLNIYAEFFCLEDWQDAQFLEIYGGGYPEDEEEYENPGSGAPRKTKTFGTFQPNDSLVNFNYYRFSFMFYGRYQIGISTIDENYLQYLYKPEGFNHGGINGGIGYFGSARTHALYTKIVEDRSN